MDGNNSVAIHEEPYGLARVELSLLTRIQNPKRRIVLSELLLRQAAQLEQAVAAMDYEQIEQTHENLKPTGATNGHNELRDIETQEDTEDL